MRDYLTNLVARNLEPTPAIRPRLASLFEPLSVVSPLFPGPGRVGDRFETIAARDEAISDALTQPRADYDPGTKPPLSSLPTTPSKVTKESAASATNEDPPLISDQQRKPATTTVKLAEPEPPIPRETDDPGTREQIVSESRPSEESKAKIVVPVIGLPVSSESSQQDQPRWREKAPEATKREVAVTLVANTYEASRPGEAARPDKKSVDRRNSESLNESRAQDRSTASIPLSPEDQSHSSLQSLIVPRAAIETIRADRGSRSPIFTESAAHRGATVPTAIANIKPHEDSRARPTGTEGDEPTGPEAQPSINVTIGRVEVRALLPTTPPSRKNSESPKLMGLDDYLRQRAQGGRR